MHNEIIFKIEYTKGFDGRWPYGLLYRGLCHHFYVRSDPVCGITSQESGIFDQYPAAECDGNGCNLFCQSDSGFAAATDYGRGESGQCFDIRNPWITWGCTALRHTYFSIFVTF